MGAVVTTVSDLNSHAVLLSHPTTRPFVLLWLADVSSVALLCSTGRPVYLGAPEAPNGPDERCQSAIRRSCRRLPPLAIWVPAGGWLFSCRCTLPGSPRTFRLKQSPHITLTHDHSDDKVTKTQRAFFAQAHDRAPA